MNENTATDPSTSDSERVEEHDIVLTPHDIDHLNAGQPIYKGIGEDVLLTIYPDEWSEREFTDTDRSESDQ